MINDKLYELEQKERRLQYLKGLWYKKRNAEYIECYNEWIQRRKENHKVFELERTSEGYTQIRKIRL